jgi:hypothetical protein
VGDAIMRFGGQTQSPSTMNMPGTKNRNLLAQERAEAEAKAKAKADAAKKKITINCVKGKTVKKVIAINPKCPSRYKKR